MRRPGCCTCTCATSCTETVRSCRLCWCSAVLVPQLPLLPCSWLHSVDAAAAVALLLSCCCCALLGKPHCPVAATMLRLVQHAAACACSHPAEAVRIVEGQAQTCDAAQKPRSCAFCCSCNPCSQVAQLSGGGPLGRKSQRLQPVTPARQRAELVKRRPTQPCVAGACEWLELPLRAARGKVCIAGTVRPAFAVGALDMCKLLSTPFVQAPELMRGGRATTASDV